jgi:hypothetical protein
MRCISTLLISLLLAVPAMSVELFRYSGIEPLQKAAVRWNRFLRLLVTEFSQRVNRRESGEDRRGLYDDLFFRISRALSISRDASDSSQHGQHRVLMGLLCYSFPLSLFMGSGNAVLGARVRPLFCGFVSPASDLVVCTALDGVLAGGQQASTHSPRRKRLERHQ